MCIRDSLWYRIDVKANWTSNPNLIDWMVNSAPQTQVSVGQAGTTAFSWQVGSPNSTTMDVVFDDIMFSNTSADYPIADGFIVGYPILTTSGTHVQTAGDLKD